MTLSLDPEAARLTALYEYGILDTPAEDVFDNLTQLAAQLCDTPIALLSYIDADRQWFKAKVGVDASEMPRRKAVCSHTMTQKNVLVVVDASGDERFIANPQGADAPSIRFYAGVPLTDSDGHTLGTLCVMDYVPHSVDSKQQQGLKALAHQAVTQLEQRRKIRQLEDKLLHTNPPQMPVQLKLRQVIRQILAEATTLSQGAVRLLQALGDTSHWDIGEFWLVDRPANVVRCLATWSRVPGQFAEFEKSAQSWVFAPGLGLPGQTWSNNEPIWMSDLIHNKQCLRSHIAQRVGLHSALGCPIISEDVTLGVITLLSYKVQPPNDDLMTAIMGAMADQVGHFIERKQAEELQQQNLQSRLFAAIALHIRQSLRRDDILNTTVVEVRQFLKVDRVLIYHFSDDWKASVIVESVDPAWSSALGTHPEDTCFLEGSWQKYQEGQVTFFNNLEFATLTPCHRHLLKQFQVKASLVVPIRLQNADTEPALWGLLIAHQCVSPRHWHSYEVECLTQLADQVAIALTQANLLDQERQQREILSQQNAALKQAHLESDRISRLKSDVLATMSDEICPAIKDGLGVANLLVSSDLNPEQRAMVETIRASTSSVLTFINRMLSVSQLEAEDFSAATDPTLETLGIDRELSMQDNEIRDTINRDNVDFDDSTKNAIIKDTIIKANTSDHRTVFHPQSRPEAPSDTAGIPLLDSFKQSVSDLKILLVEDNGIDQKVTLDQLKHLGYRVDIATTGKEALAKLTGMSYDLILMECQTPTLDDCRMMHTIPHHQDQQQHAVILALKAHALLKHRKRCAPTGIDIYLSKLLSKKKLPEKLDHRDDGLKSHHFTEPIDLRPMTLLIDWEQLHAISDDNAEFERELLHIFVDDTEARLAIAHLALREQNQEQLARAAHHIKGSSANIGLYRMQQVAARLEQRVSLNEWTELETLLTQLVDILNEVRNYLKNP